MYGNCEKKCKLDDKGKIIAVYYVPDKMEKQRKHFIREMNKQGAWMPESNFRQIIESYNEAFNARLFCDDVLFRKEDN